MKNAILEHYLIDDIKQALELGHKKFYIISSKKHKFTNQFVYGEYWNKYFNAFVFYKKYKNNKRLASIEFEILNNEYVIKKFKILKFRKEIKK